MPKVVVKIITCSPTNPNWRWYEDRIGQVFPVTRDGDQIIEVWDGKSKIDRLVLRCDVVLVDG